MRPGARRYTITLRAEGKGHRLVLADTIRDALPAVPNANQAKIRENRDPG